MYIWYIHYQLLFLRFQHTMIMSTKPRTDPPRKKPRFPPISPKRQVQSQIRNSLSYENRKESNERCTTQSESPSVPNQAFHASELNENLGLQNKRNCMMAKKGSWIFSDTWIWQQCREVDNQSSYDFQTENWWTTGSNPIPCHQFLFLWKTTVSSE